MGENFVNFTLFFILLWEITMGNWTFLPIFVIEYKNTNLILYYFLLMININKSELVIPPTMLTFITTNKCTASCKNCCFKCNPKNGERLSFEAMKQYVDAAIKDFNTIKTLVFTGGECFTLGSDLLKIIEYGAEKGLITRVVTNAYWARSFKKTYRLLSDLQNVGLNELNISTGDEHLEWVPLDNIINALSVAVRLNITTVVSVESSEFKNFKKDMLLNDVRLRKYNINACKNIHIFNGHWIYFDEQDKNSPKTNSIISNCSGKRCASLFSSLTICFDNSVISCCGIIPLDNKYLFLGKADKYSLKELYEYQFDDFIKIWLFTEGPLEILNFCLRHRNLDEFKGNVHSCQICSMIFKDKENIDVLRTSYKEVMQKVYWKYILLKRKYDKQYKYLNYEKQ